MAEVLRSPVFAVTITFLFYFLAQGLYRRYRVMLLNPVLVSVVVLIVFLKSAGISYSRYMEGGHLISFFLGPAVVALGVPLYLQLETIRKQGSAILSALLVGSVSGIVIAAGTAFLLGASKEVVLSLAPKSVTTPIAMAIAGEIGGIEPLTAALVVATGLLGGVAGPAVLKLLGIDSPTAFGLAMGAAAHGIGTARALEEGEVQGAMSGLALCLNGIFTALLTPLFIRLFF